MKNYLIEQGIKEDHILIEDKSKNTFENIASNQNINIEGIGAKTKTYFWVNAFIREFIATLFSEKKKHITIVCCIIVLALFMILLQYLFNTL